MADICFKLEDKGEAKILNLFEKTIEDLKEDVCIIKEWLKTQSHLPEIPSDKMIEYFIVNNKFSLENTKQKIINYYMAMNTIHEQLGNINPKLDWIKSVRNIQYLVPLPKLVDDIYRVVIVAYKNVPAERVVINNLLADIINIYETRMHEDLMVGDIFILDHKHWKMENFFKLTPKYFKLWTSILENVYSNRIKEVHFINYIPAIDIALKLAKLFLKPKLYNRINLHKSLESLCQKVPIDILPKEYGGLEKPLDELQDIWTRKLEEYGPRFDKLEKMRVQETQKLNEKKLVDNYGVHGTFKKLNID